MEEKILLVEDEIQILEYVGAILEKQGYRVKKVSTGEKAIEVIRNEVVDIIILDINLPGQDGISTLAEIRKIEEQNKRLKAPVIIFTGLTSEDIPIKALKLRADDYVKKPVNRDELLHSIQRNLKIRTLEQERILFTEMLARANQELKDTNERLAKANERLLELQEVIVNSAKLSMVGRLASIISHELKNPLMTIKNISYFLLKTIKKKDTKTDKMLDILNNEIERSIGIIDSLLEFSKTKVLKKSKTNINELISHTIQEFLINNKIDIEEDLENIEFILDPNLFKKMLLILLENARDAIYGLKDGKVLVVLKRLENGFKLSVSDTGCGMDEESLAHIFEPLFTTKTKGLGLGMVYVKEIIDLHNGRISIESSKNRGTSINIEFIENIGK